MAPHHLLLTVDDIGGCCQGKYGVKPPIVTSEDQKALWNNFDVIDCFATDHGMLLLLVMLNVCFS